MATQMSPQGSPCSSPNLRPSFSASTPSALPITEWQSVASSKMDIRDVQVDEHVTMRRWSKKHRALFSGRGSENVESRQMKEISNPSSAWDISETPKTVSKYAYIGIVSIQFSLSGKLRRIRFKANMHKNLELIGVAKKLTLSSEVFSFKSSFLLCFNPKGMSYTEHEMIFCCSCRGNNWCL